MTKERLFSSKFFSSHVVITNSTITRVGLFFACGYVVKLFVYKFDFVGGVI